MLTLYAIVLTTTNEDRDPTQETLYSPGPEETFDLLCQRMNAGDTALIYQIDVYAPTTAEEAVAWLNGDPRMSIQVLVGEATRDSDYEAVVITPYEIKGFVVMPAIPFQA